MLLTQWDLHRDTTPACLCFFECLQMCVSLCVYVRVQSRRWPRIKFLCGQKHTTLSHYCLLVRCDRGNNGEQDKMRKPECTKSHVQANNLIWYPICWTTPTPLLSLLSPSLSLILSLEYLSLALSFPPVEHFALANFLQVCCEGNFSLKYTAYFAACISSCACVSNFGSLSS